MIANGDNQPVVDLSQQPFQAETWHLWTVLVPRRSITGRIVYGSVWRATIMGGAGSSSSLGLAEIIGLHRLRHP
jgi:hypothetical protein